MFKRKEITETIIQSLQEDTQISSVTQDDTVGTLIVQTTAGERFTITTAPLKDNENATELQNYKNFFTIYMEIMLMQMKKQHILSDEEYIEIWSRISEHAGAI